MSVLGVYRLALDAVISAFRQALLPVLRGFDVRNADDRKTLAPVLFELVKSYRGDAVFQANQFMVEQAQQFGKQAYLPEPEPYSVEAVETTLRESKSSQMLADSLSRHVETAARRQVQRATPGDDYASEPNKGTGAVADDVVTAYPVAWARVLSGAENCPFCVMLASRGAVYSSKTRAGADLYRYHNRCDCLVVPVYDYDDWPGKETADYLYKIWRENGSLKTLGDWMKENTLTIPDIRDSLATAA